MIKAISFACWSFLNHAFEGYLGRTKTEYVMLLRVKFTIKSMCSSIG